jgi:hypothetical protein
MDEFGIDHGFLMNGCRTAKDTVAPVRGGRVLPLDGTSQYVELHNSLNDFKDSSFALWFKYPGGASEQCLWSMGNGSNKTMALTPNAAGSGVLAPPCHLWKLWPNRLKRCPPLMSGGLGRSGRRASSAPDRSHSGRSHSGRGRLGTWRPPLFGGALLLQKIGRAHV